MAKVRNVAMKKSRGLTGFAVLSACLLTLTACSADSPAKPAAAERPNILMILVDDLGYNQLGVTGSPKIKTPNIDKLAADGIFFSDAYSGSTVCSPSRVSLMTGRDARLLSTNTNSITLTAEDRTVAHVLSDSGYETALFGKYGIGSSFGKNDPMAMGFTQWSGLLHNIEAHRQYPIMRYDNNTVSAVGPNLGAKEGLYAQRMFTNSALNFLDNRDGDKPFFMLLSYTAPHADLAAPEEFVAPYRGQFKERAYPGWEGDPKAWGYPLFYPGAVSEPQAVLSGMVAALDSYIGEVVEKLDEQGLADNTIIVLASDNGPHNEGGADVEASEASKPYRGGKRDLYEGGIRTPMIVRWSAKSEGGRVENEPVAFADYLPTFAQAAGAGDAAFSGAVSNGQSFLPFIKQADVPPRERILYWEFGRQLGGKAADKVGTVAQAGRKGQWKAVRPDQDAAIELYDLSVDPGESNDVSADHPSIMTEFETLFKAEMPG